MATRTSKDLLRKTLSLFLALVMALSVMSVPAFAASKQFDKKLNAGTIEKAVGEKGFYQRLPRMFKQHEYCGTIVAVIPVAKYFDYTANGTNGIITGDFNLGRYKEHQSDPGVGLDYFGWDCLEYDFTAVRPGIADVTLDYSYHYEWTPDSGRCGGCLDYFSYSGGQLDAYSITDMTVKVYANYTLNFDANGGSGAPNPMGAKKVFDVECSATIPQTTPTKDGAKFLGWSEDRDANAADYQPGDSYTAYWQENDGANVQRTLYAVWEDEQPKNTFKMTYHSNDGTEKVAYQYVDSRAEEFAALGAGTFTRDGWTLQGWSIHKGYDYVEVPLGGPVRDPKNMDFYAVWQKNPEPVPEEPALDDISQYIDIKVKCDTNEAEHPVKGYALIEGSYTATEPKKDSEGVWKSTVTIQREPYIGVYSNEYGPHESKSDAPAQTHPLYWKDGKWYAGKSTNGALTSDKVTYTFEVKCVEQQPEPSKLEVKKLLISNVTGLKVGDDLIWSIVITGVDTEGTDKLYVTDNGVTLYADKDCTQPLPNDGTGYYVENLGDTVTVYAKRTVTENDLDQKITNEASAKQGSRQASGSNTSGKLPAAKPALEVTKIITSTPANGTAYAAGETIIYKITVTNTGNVPLSDVTVNDPMTNDSWTIETLAPGESKTFTAEYVVDQSDLGNETISNTATAKAGDGTSGSATDANAKVQDRNPDLKVTKTVTSTPANGQYYAAGETITYEITVTNTGNVDLSGITVTDTFSGERQFLTWKDGNDPTAESFGLTAGATATFTATYTVQEDDLGKPLTNSAEASYNNPITQQQVTEPSDEVSSTVESRNPNLTVTKKIINTPADGSTYELGETITYTITVTNSGNVTVTDIKVTDPLTNEQWTIDSLAPKAFQTFNTSYTVTQNDIDKGNGSLVNTASATGKDSNEDVTDDGSVTATLPATGPSLTVTKTANGTPTGADNKYAVGDVITYTVTVTNNGNVTVSDITVTDTFEGAGSLTWTEENGDPTKGGFDLAPNTSREFIATYMVQEADLGKDIINTATASGTAPNGTPVTSGDNDNNTVTDQTVAANSALTVEKRITSTPANGTAYRPGETINYTITVTNSGNVTVTGITVTDPLTGLQQTIETLASGESKDFTTSYVVTDADGAARTVNNTATAAGTNGESAEVTNSGSVSADTEPTPAAPNPPTGGGTTGGGGTTPTPTPDPDEPDPPVEDIPDEPNPPLADAHTVTVHYVDDEGNTIAPDTDDSWPEGNPYFVDIPEIEGYTYDHAEGGTFFPDLTEDVEVTLVYTADVTDIPDDPEPPLAGTHTVTVHYVDEAGNTIAEDLVVDWPEGSPYLVETPVIDGYTYDHAVGDTFYPTLTEDVEVTVVYTRDEQEPATYTVTVRYIDTNGNTLLPASVTTYAAGAAYTVTAPSINGYLYYYASGAVSGIVTGDVAVTLVYVQDTYVPSTTPTYPTVPSDPTPSNPSVDIPDADVPQTDLPDTGDDGTVDITDEDVPLAGAEGLNTRDHINYIIGTPEGKVLPNNAITRAEAATIFFRLMTEPYRVANWSTVNSFSDVKSGSWYNNAVSTCANAGKLLGTPDGSFQPNRSITRAEFATIAVRFMMDGYNADVEVSDFSDTVGHWASASIRRAVQAGWITGMPDGTFHPDDPITRAEAVTIVNRMLGRVPHKDGLLAGMRTFSDNMDPNAWYYLAIQEAANYHDYGREEAVSRENWSMLNENIDWKQLEKEWVANGGYATTSAAAE